MASIKERPGGAYLIRVSGGYTPQGKQKVHTMTWKAPAGMTPAKARKEAERQAILFEEQCKAQGIGNGHIKFETFARQWLKEYAERKLRPRTVARLHSLEDRTYQAIGHIYIDKLTARQVQAFIDNLGEDGISEKADRAEPKADLRKLLKAENMTQKDLADKAGISYSTASSLCRGESVTKATADKVAAALGRKDLFTLKKGAGRLAPKSIQHYLSFISSVMEYAYRFELVKANPCKRVVIPTGEKTEREVYTLEEDDRGLFTPEEGRLLHLLSRRLGRLRDDAQLLREYCLQVRELFQTEVEIRQNRIMKALTLVTTLCLPLSLVAGWYGMNFTGMPELSWKYGYPAVIVVSVLIVSLCLWIMKKKKFW